MTNRPAWSLVIGHWSFSYTSPHAPPRHDRVEVRPAHPRGRVRRLVLLQEARPARPVAGPPRPRPRVAPAGRARLPRRLHRLGPVLRHPPERPGGPRPDFHGATGLLHQP